MGKNKKVLATGIFDLLHIGHIYFLTQASKQGDYLTVLVTCDKVARAQKRKPIYNERERKDLVASLKVVNETIVGNKIINYCQTLKEINPDILALGFDQDLNIEAKLEKCDWKGKIARIAKYPNKIQSTTNIIRTIKRGESPTQINSTDIHG